MKRTLFIFFLSLTVINCSNDDDSIQYKLIGDWNWIKSSGGIDDRVDTPLSTGNSITLKISNNSVKKYVNGNLESELNYSIQIGESSIIEGQHEMIFYDNDFSQTIVLSKNHLILYDECNDCFKNEYERSED